MKLKQWVRSTLNFLHLDLSKNLEYDRLTLAVMRKVLRPDSNCIDVGCHKGEVLEAMLRLAPQGRHWGFEPIPGLHAQLLRQFGARAQILPFALADHDGKAQFQHVRNAPAYSGLKRRSYAVSEPDIETLEVDLRRLDDLLPPETAVHLVKIDVEDAELGVLRGARQTLARHRPVVIFEFGLGASDFYGTTAQDLHELFNGLGMAVSTLKGFLNAQEGLGLRQFEEHFARNDEYYFVAHPRD